MSATNALYMIQLSELEQRVSDAKEILESYEWETDKRCFIWTPEGQTVLELLQPLSGDEK